VSDKDIQINQEHFLVCSDVQQCNVGEGPVRAFNTTYHNCQAYREFWEDYCVRAHPRFVTVSIKLTADHTQGACQCWITDDALADEPWWREVGRAYVNYYGTAVNLYDSVTFVVPPGWYYKVAQLASAQLGPWMEWDMGIADRLVLTDKLKPEE